MAKKKAAKKTTSKKPTAKPAKKSAVKKSTAKKKRPVKNATAKKSPKKVTRAKRPTKKAARPVAKTKAPARSRNSAPKQKRSSPVLAPNQYREQMAVTIEGPNKSGDIVATETLGDVARVHHTVHPGAETTAIPGQSYRDLKDLGEGTHDIEVVRTLAPPAGAATENAS